MIKFLNPSYVFKISGKLLNIFKTILIPLVIIGLVFSLFLSPEDYIQGDSVRIMYIHVTAAWISLFSFAAISFFCILNFLFKLKNVTLVYKSLAPIGLTFNIVAVVTGSLWGQPTWGTWWAWDARITSMFILVLFYGMYLLAWRIYEDNQKVIRITSLIAIIGVVNIPIIKFSVDWWNTLHQPASINILATNTSIHSSMLIPLSIMTAAFALFSLLIFLMKYNTELIKVKNKGLNRL